MRSPFLSHLSPALQRSLTRWYLLSLVCLMTTAGLLTGLHITMLRSITQLQRRLQTCLLANRVDPSESLLQRRKLLQEQKDFFSIMQLFFDSIPASVHLVMCTIEPTKQISCKGVTSSSTSLTEMLTAFEKAGFPILTTFDAHEEDGQQQFYIKVTRPASTQAVVS